MAVRSLSVGEWSKTDGELSEWVTEVTVSW